MKLDTRTGNEVRTYVERTSDGNRKWTSNDSLLPLLKDIKWKRKYVGQETFNNIQKLDSIIEQLESSKTN